MATAPLITYLSITHKVCNGVSNGLVASKDEAINVSFTRNIAALSAYKVSYNSPFNVINGTFKANRPVTTFEIRVYPAEATSYGPGEGARVFVMTGITANTEKQFTFAVDATAFSGSQSNTYRVCLFAQSELDYS